MNGILKTFTPLFILLLAILCFPQQLRAQKYFEFSEEIDTSATNFYDKNYHITLCYIASQPDNYYGGAALIHYNKERFSTYWEFNTNIDNTYKITGATQSGLSTRQKEVHYTNWIAATGVGSAIGTDWILFASIGVQNETTRMESDIENGYLYNKDKDQMNIHLGAGAFYFTPVGITLYGGYNITSDALKLGIGYTF